MKRMLLLFALLFSVSLQAAELDSKEAAKSLTRTTMNKILESGTLEGLTPLKKYMTVVPSAEFDAMLEQYKMQESMIKHRFGNSIGVEFIKEEEIGESLFLITYIQKFELHLMRWQFYFYKPKDKWVLNTFFTDDKIKSFFEN